MDSRNIHEEERIIRGHNGEGMGPGEARTPTEPRTPTERRTAAGEPSRAAGSNVIERRALAEVAVGGSAVGVLTGAIAAVLAIVGLAGTLSFYMTAIATIALGAGLFAEGGSLGTALGKLERQGVLEEDTAVGGFAMHGVAGAAAIVLGILALLGVLPGVLVAIAVLTMGGAMLFGGPTRAELNLSALEQEGVSPMGRRAATKAVHNSAGLLILVGLASITLGILALVQVPFAPTLLLVALLALGATLLLGDSLLLGGIGSSLFRSRHARQHG